MTETNTSTIPTDKTSTGGNVAEQRVVMCADCKYWTKDTDMNYPQNIALGKCKRVKLFWDCTEWDEDSGDFGGLVLKKSAQGNKAFVQDGSDYKAELITFRDFGCVQGEYT